MTNEEARKREDMLLDLYKTKAYLPNDAEGNPLTPFGNFCAGYEAAAFSGGAQVVSIEDIYELLSPNSFENIARKYSHYYNDTWHFSDEFLKQFAEVLLEDKEREIAELKAEVKKWKTNSVDLEYACLDRNLKIDELKAHINQLREALISFDIHDSTGLQTLWTTNMTAEQIDDVIASTPAQSLIDFENETIERVMALMEDMNANGKYHLPDYIEAIRALKVTE